MTYDEDDEEIELPDDYDPELYSIDDSSGLYYNIEERENGSVTYRFRSETGEIYYCSATLPFCPYCSEDGDRQFPEHLLGYWMPCSHYIGKMGDCAYTLPDIDERCYTHELLAELRDRGSKIKDVAAGSGTQYDTDYHTFWYAENVAAALEAALAIPHEWREAAERAGQHTGVIYRETAG
jgi:hypothetical protein